MPVFLMMTGIGLVIVSLFSIKYTLLKRSSYPIQMTWFISLFLFGIFLLLWHFFTLDQVLSYFIIIGLFFLLFDQLKMMGKNNLIIIELNKALQAIIPWFLALVLLHTFLFSFYYISSCSMRPTLSEGDIVIVFPINSLSFLSAIKGTQKSSIKKGDVIIFRDPKQKINLVKRVLGLSGDDIIYYDKNLLINRKNYDENFLHNFFYTGFSFLSKIGDKYKLTDLLSNSSLEEFKIIKDNQLYSNKLSVKGRNCVFIIEGVRCKIPRDKYFVVGDNRGYSVDSRHYGLINLENVVGKVRYTFINIPRFNHFFKTIR